MVTKKYLKWPIFQRCVLVSSNCFLFFLCQDQSVVKFFFSVLQRKNVKKSPSVTGKINRTPLEFMGCLTGIYTNGFIE